MKVGIAKRKVSRERAGKASRESAGENWGDNIAKLEKKTFPSV